MPFTHSVQLRFSDADAMGHVNNARPLTFLEDARIAFFRSRAFDMLAGGVIVARTEVDYVRPILVTPEPLEVRLQVTDIGRSSFRLANEIVQDGSVAARAVVVMVAYDYTAGRSRPLTDEERRVLEDARA